ncbi:MAG: alpha/beta hydrolase [Treponemataceae bacterium]|nr:alpha/beta hydrolase [Treponemataceae bacterium]
MKCIIGVLCFSFAIVSCATLPPAQDPSVAFRDAIWENLTDGSIKEGGESPPPSPFTIFPLSIKEFEGSPQATAELSSKGKTALHTYLTEFYERLAVKVPFTHQYGFIPLPSPWGDYQLFVHILIPADTSPGGTILMLHGYASDSSRLSPTAGYFLSRGWVVLLADLPGHGLSTGKRGDVPSFFLYGDMVQCLVEELLPPLPRPWMALGHSTGGLALLDYCSRYTAPFERLALYAPLVRTTWWNLAKGVRFFTKPFLHHTAAYSTSPLGLRVFPVHWFDELVTWERGAQKIQELRLPPTILIQPDHDEVVNSEYNARYITARAPHVQCIRLKNIDHFELDSRSPVEELLTTIEQFFTAP